MQDDDFTNVFHLRQYVHDEMFEHTSALERYLDHFKKIILDGVRSVEVAK